MEVFVILALALAVVAVGAVVVAVVVLRKQVAALAEGMRATSEHVRRLSEELGEEVATLTLEAEALQRWTTGDRGEDRDEYTADSTRSSTDR